MPLEAAKTLEPHQGSRLVQPLQASRRGGRGFKDAAVLRNEFCGKSPVGSELSIKEAAKVAACVSCSGAEEASPRCFFSRAFIEDTEDEEGIPSERQGASSTPSKQQATAEKTGERGCVLRVAFDADSQRREVTLIRGSKKSDRLREVAASLASPKQEATLPGAPPSAASSAGGAGTAPSTARVRQQQQQLQLQKDALVQVEAGTGDLESVSCFSLRAAAGSCLLSPSRQSEQLQAAPLQHAANSLPGRTMSQRSAACLPEGPQQPPTDIQEGSMVGGGPREPHCFLAGPNPTQQMHAAASELSPARAAAPASNGCNGLGSLTPFSAWAQVQQQQQMQRQQLQQHMQQQQMQQQHMQGGAGVPAGLFYPAVWQPLWVPPALSFGQQYWVGCPWVPQRQGPHPPSLCHARPSPSCLPQSAGSGALSQQVLQRSTSAASSGALRRYSVGGPRRSSIASSEQPSQKGLHEGGPFRGPPSHEPQQLLLSQHLQHMRQQQQKRFSQPEDLLPIHSKPNQQPRRSALSATLPTGCQRSSSCSRLTNRSNCLPPQWEPQWLPELQAEWGLPDASGSCCWRPPNPSAETDGRGASLAREASLGSQTQEGAPLPHFTAEALCKTFQSEATAGVTAAAAAAEGCSAAAAMGHCCSAAAAAAAQASNRGPLRESPAAIGGRILRRLQTLKDLLEGHDTRGGPLAEVGGPPTEAPEGLHGAPLDPCSCHEPNAMHGGLQAERPAAGSDTCVCTKGALNGGPPAEPLQDRIALEQGPPSCIEGEPASAASAEKPGSSLGSREGGLSLIAAGVPRLTLAMLNGSGGPGGAGGGGGPSRSLPPRKGPPSSVFQAPRRPASPEPLGERPGRGPLRREREEGDSRGSSAASCHEASQQGEEGTARQMMQHFQGHPHAIQGAPLNDFYLCLPDDSTEHAAEGLLGRPFSMRAPWAGGEAAGGRGDIMTLDAAGEGDGIQEVQGDPSLRVNAFLSEAAEAPESSEAAGLQRETDSWQEQALSSPPGVSVSRSLQQQRVKWALWTGAGLSGVGGSGEKVLSAEEASGVPTPAHPKPLHGSVSAYPSLPVALGGCRSSRLDFYLPVYTAEETGDCRFEPPHHETGLAVCEKEGLRLMVLWEGPRERSCGIVDPHAQIAVCLLEELHARGDPRRALEAAFAKVFASLSEEESRVASAAAALVLGQKDETGVSGTEGGLSSSPLHVLFKQVGSAKALAACQAAERPGRVTFNSGREGEIWEVTTGPLEVAGICLGNASFWEAMQESQVSLQLCAQADTDPQFLRSLVASLPSAAQHVAAAGMQL
ncbi:hypothetical protein Esti_000670 [Eimeria stiedai]